MGSSVLIHVLFATRQVHVRLCLAAGLALSLSMLGRDDNGGPLQFEAACTIATLAVALLGPVVLTVLWGSVHDAQLEEVAALSGTPRTRTRVVLMLAGFALLTVWAGTSIVLTLLLGMGQAGDPAAAGVPDQSVAKLTVLAATIVVVCTWVPGLMVRLGTRSGLAVVSVLTAFYLAARIVGSGPLSLLRALVPTTAIEVIDDGREGVAAGLGFAAVVLLAMHISIAVYRLWAPPLPHRGAFRTRITPHTQSGWKRRLGWWTAIAVAAGALIPVAVTNQLPVEWRPSLALSRLNDAAPDQVADSYLLALRTHNHAAEERLSTRDPWAGSDMAREEFTYGASGIVELIAVDGWRQAQVSYWSGPRYAVVCLTHPATAWVVDEISS